MSMIRAKFRCMSVTRQWDGNEIVSFRPVNRGKEQDPENAKFWDASPSGEAKLTFKGPCGFLPGAYYYIDMAADPEGEWTTGTVSRHCGGGGHVSLYRQWQEVDEGLFQGSLEIGLNYIETVNLFGAPDGVWAVSFTFAEASDN